METLGLGFGNNQTVGVYRAGAPGKNIYMSVETRKSFAYFLGPFSFNSCDGI